MIKINEEGEVAIVHQPEGIPDNKVPSHVRSDTPNFFRVSWTDSLFPNLSNGCGNGACNAIAEECWCSIDVFEEVVYTSRGILPTLASDVLSELHIGNLAP